MSIYAKARLQDGKLQLSNVKIFNQRNLTSECWLVQINGLEYCNGCESKDSEECGGKRIRQTGRNAAGIDIPISLVRNPLSGDSK